MRLTATALQRCFTTLLQHCLAFRMLQAKARLAANALLQYLVNTSLTSCLNTARVQAAGKLGQPQALEVGIYNPSSPPCSASHSTSGDQFVGAPGGQQGAARLFPLCLGMFDGQRPCRSSSWFTQRFAHSTTARRHLPTRSSCGRQQQLGSLVCWHETATCRKYRPSAAQQSPRVSTSAAHAAAD